MLAFVDSMGEKDVILQTDQETSIIASAEKFRGKRKDATILRQAPKGSHESLGVVERGRSPCNPTSGR